MQLTAIGPRQAGSDEESRTAELIAARLRDMGYRPEIRTFVLSNGETSRSVVARAVGSSKRVIVVGAHMDSVVRSPGAEDNASGCASLLELARAVAGRPLYVNVEFVFFGSEERIDDDETHHMAGSAAYVRSLTAGERAATVAMVDMDCVGFGTQFSAVTMSRASQKLSNLLVKRAKAAGVALAPCDDARPLGMSDHASFERVGIPSVFLWWHDDGRMHTPQDTVDHLVIAKVRAAGELVLGLLLEADKAILDGLAAAHVAK